MKKYLTVQQFAAKHGVSRQAVWKWIHAGKLRIEEIAGRVLIWERTKRP